MAKNKLALGCAALAVMTMGLAGCGNQETATYTYREALSSTPSTWNVHTWKESTESIIFGYTEMGLYDFTLGDDGKGYKIVPEMASGEPIDDSANVTADEVDKYGMETDSTGEVEAGSKWLINLNTAACWEDGTAITADDYVGSMERLLNPKMANYRASSWYTGDVVLGNAEGYFKSGRTLYNNPFLDGDGNEIEYDRLNDDYYGSLYDKIPFLGYSLYYLYHNYGVGTGSDAVVAAFADEATWGNSSTAKYPDLSTNSAALTTYATVISDILEDGFGMAANSVQAILDNPTTARFAAWYFTFVAVASPVVSFDDVGIKKVSDSQIALYLLQPSSLFNLKMQLSGNWIVNIPLYDQYKTTVGDLTTTTYANALDKYKSYGPYKLTSFIADKEIVVSKNDKWYGYTDGKHEGQYSIDTFNMQVVSNLDTQLLMFERGDIDSIGLRSTDMKKYSTSPYLMYTPQSYTDKIALNSSYSRLKERQTAQGTNINKVILANKTFREALSWALDRSTFCQTETAGSTPALGVINKMYVADEASGVLYRNTTAGQRVISDVYGDSTDGFNKTKAAQLITQACGETNEAGEPYYTTGQKVSLEFVVYNEDWRTSIENHIEDFVDATVGTPLEGNFEVTITITTDNQDTILAGNAELCMDIWGGAQMNPYGIPETWLDVDNRTCYGFNPDAESIDIDLDGDGEISATERRTNNEWYTALSTGEFSAARATYQQRTVILSYLEEFMLSNHYFLTVRSRNSVSIDSFRVTEGTEEYQALVGYGGVRDMKLTQSDQQWATTVSAGLDYTK